jgi:hypothetical protein
MYDDIEEMDEEEELEFKDKLDLKDYDGDIAFDNSLKRRQKSF